MPLRPRKISRIPSLPMLSSRAFVAPLLDPRLITRSQERNDGRDRLHRFHTLPAAAASGPTLLALHSGHLLNRLVVEPPHTADPASAKDCCRQRHWLPSDPWVPQRLAARSRHTFQHYLTDP